MLSEDDRRAAFERMFHETYGPVRAYVLRRAPEVSAEDVLAEVFLTAWRRFDELAADPLPWLFGVARRMLANQLRSDRRRLALTDRLAGTPADDLVWQPPLGLRDELAVAVGALSPVEREALLLWAWEGLTPDRAARVAGCSRAAFRVRLHRARRRVAAALAAGDRSRSSILGGTQ